MIDIKKLTQIATELNFALAKSTFDGTFASRVYLADILRRLRVLIDEVEAAS